MPIPLVSLLGLALVTSTGHAGPANPAPVPPWAAAALAPDTLVEVRQGDAVVVETWTGSLSVRVGEADVVRVVGAEDGEGAGVTRNRSVVRVAPRWPGEDGDLVLEVPRWVMLRVRSKSLDVDAQGLEGGVGIELLEGDVRLHGVSGAVVVETLDGEVEVRDVNGDVRLSALDGDIQLRRVRGGVVMLQSAHGELELDDVEAEEISATTVDGDVHFRGRFPPGGTLTLTTHDGDVRAWLPAGVGAQVAVSTFDGSFESDFPVRTRGFRAGEPLRFTVGDGSARVVLESFDGDIRLLSW